MKDSVTVVFGDDKKPRNSTLVTRGEYNDGQWHHVVAVLESAGMRLYLDGDLVASNSNPRAIRYQGYWRVGGDVIGSSWRLFPTSENFAGQLDEFAVYPTPLSAQNVSAHHAHG